jgi:hypothetical protein
MKFNSIFIFSLVTFILLLLFSFSIDPFSYNPFKNKINIPNSFVENFLGEDLDLNENTDKNNPMKLKKVSNKKKTSYKNLVFTSAGDNTKFDKLWTGSNQNYDVMAVYYGKNQKKFNQYESKVDYIMQRKGSKFQNFHYVYNNHRDIIDKYDRFFILDDDIIFDVKDINEMFRLSKKNNFWICGPTFKNIKECKISHDITISKPGNLFRYTNFIEVNVPLFNKYALNKLMKYYDPILIGWGIDFLYMWSCGLHHKNKYALVDKVTCINPHDNTKGGTRELNQIKNVNSRQKIWEDFKKKYGIKNQKQKTWSEIKL